VQVEFFVFGGGRRLSMGWEGGAGVLGMGGYCCVLFLESNRSQPWHDTTPIAAAQDTEILSWRAERKGRILPAEGALGCFAKVN